MRRRFLTGLLVFTLVSTFAATAFAAPVQGI